MGVLGEAQDTPDLEERNEAIYKAWSIWNKPHRIIAKEFGISQQRVSQIIAQWRKDHPTIREDLAAQSISMLNELRERQFQLAEQIKDGAPVAVGKDGLPLLDPDKIGRASCRERV